MSYMPVKSAPTWADRRVRPFDAEVVTRARDLCGRYEIEVEPDTGANGYVGRVKALPTVFGCGQSAAEAGSTTRELLQWTLAYLIEAGRPLPPFEA